MGAKYSTAQVQGILSESSGALPRICHTTLQTPGGTQGEPNEAHEPPQKRQKPGQVPWPHSLRRVQYADVVYGYSEAQVQGILSQSSCALPTIWHTPTQTPGDTEMQKTGDGDAKVQLPTQLDKCPMCRNWNTNDIPEHGVGVCRSSTQGTSCSCTCIASHRKANRIQDAMGSAIFWGLTQLGPKASPSGGGKV